MRAITAMGLIGTVLALAAGCTCEKMIESATDDMVKMVRAGGEISKELKVPAHVSVSLEQGGKVVTVRLQRPPEEQMEQARPKIEAIVRKHIPGVREVRIAANL